MPGSEELSFAFIEAHPADAARVLERVAPQHVGTLLAALPARLAAPVLRAMSPLHVARCLESVADETASGLLRAMGPQAGVAVMHYVVETRRHALLAQLPTALGMAFRLLAGYPQDTVGAWMDPRVMALSADTTAEAALDRLRETDGASERCIFVLGSGQRLLGLVNLADVVRAPPAAPLSRLTRAAAHTLPARAALRAVAEHAGWQDFQLLPVVEQNDHFVGALERGVVTRAVQRERELQSDNAYRYSDAAAIAAGAYWQGVTALIEAAVALIPVAAPQRSGESHEC